MHPRISTIPKQEVHRLEKSQRKRWLPQLPRGEFCVWARTDTTSSHSFLQDWTFVITWFKSWNTTKTGLDCHYLIDNLDSMLSCLAHVHKGAFHVASWKSVQPPLPLATGDERIDKVWRYPVSFVNNSSLIVAGQLTCTVLWLLSLITRRRSRTVLIFISPRAAIPP